MKYFNNCNTLDELKKEYRRLAMQNHPDRGGDAETMKAINAEYDNLFPLFKLRYNQTAAHPTHETAESTRREFYTQNGWAGENYEPGRSLKEIAQIVRAYIKRNYPTYKFSVRTSYASMCQELHVEMKESPVEIYKPFDSLTETEKHDLIRKMEHNWLFKLTSWSDEDLRREFERIWAEHGNFYRQINEQTAAVVADVDDFVNSYNYDDCDGMIDYFDVNFYYFGCCQNNGTDVKIVQKTARIKGTEAKQSQTTPEKEPETAAALRVQINDEFNGIEVYFPDIPSAETRSALKDAGWRWHSKKKCWYNRNTESNLHGLRAITEGADAKSPVAV